MRLDRDAEEHWRQLGKGWNCFEHRRNEPGLVGRMLIRRDEASQLSDVFDAVKRIDG